MSLTAIRSAVGLSALVLLSCSLVLTSVFDLWAQGPAASGDDPSLVTAESVTALKASVEGDTQVPEVTKKNILDLCDETLARLTEIEGEAKKGAAFQKNTKDAPDLLKEAQATPTDPSTDIEIPTGASADDIQRLLVDAKAREETARSKVGDLETESQRRIARIASIPKDIAQRQQRFSSAQKALKASSGEGEEPRLGEARFMSESTKLILARASIATLRSELESYQAEADLLEARHDQAQSQQVRTSEAVTKLQTAFDSRRQEEANQAAEEAKEKLRTAAFADPFIKVMAQENADLANLRSGPDGIAARLAKASKERGSVRRRGRDLEKEFEETRKLAREVGLLESIGRLLRTRGKRLEDPRRLERALAGRRTLLSELLFEIYQRQDQYSQISRDPKAALTHELNEYLQGLSPADRESSPSDRRQQIEPAGLELLVSRKELLGDLIKDYRVYAQALRDLSLHQRELLSTVVDYRSFVDQRVIWIRSSPALGLEDIQKLRDHSEWLMDWPTWIDAMVKVRAHVLGDPFELCVLGLPMLLLILGQIIRRRFRARLEAGYDPAAQSALFPLGVLMGVLISSAFLPSLVFTGGWLLTLPDDIPTPVREIGISTIESATTILMFMFMFTITRPQGVGTQVLGWAPEGVAFLRRNLAWVLPVVLMGRFIEGLLVAHGRPEATYAVGRLAVILHMSAMAVFLASTLKPSGPVFQFLISNKRGGWLDRLQPVWYPASFCAPIALVGLAVSGYLYTAYQLGTRLDSSLCLIVGLIMLRSLFNRWLDGNQQRLADVALETAEIDPDEDSDLARARQERSAAHLARVEKESRQLFGAVIAVTAVVGFWAIWGAVTPALRLFDRVEIYPDFGRISAAPETEFVANDLDSDPRDSSSDPDPKDDQAKASASDDAKPSASETGAPKPPSPARLSLPGGEPKKPAEIRPHRVTLEDLIMAILVAAVTVIVARTLPGLVEVVLLERLPLEPGLRFAISTIARYLVVMIGLALAFRAVGIGWASVQWLAAALTFGLAFGLQEIFANFVSGLIILFEQPIRVGDAVTVGNVSGTVTRIRTRATTITDWDRKELVVPNKEFVTSRIVNWSLTDTVLRVKVGVRLAYGTDINQARTVMLDEARKHPLVLDDPAPQCYLLEFGDSSLNLELHAYVGKLVTLTVKHELHMAIDQAFRREQIEIPFPQQDLHLRPAPRSEIALERPGDEESGQSPD